ncbi:MAG: class I SAM-dependent methyltransferase [Rhodocyclaceae bacterium]|nr:class I SAM-dependent methyltransferase [Rhodocyclaceae bacterium]
MFDKAFQKLLQFIDQGRIPPIIHRVIWKTCYQFIAKKWKSDDWTFMNYGWLPENDQDDLKLDTNDEKDRYFIGLYNRLASRLDLAGKQVLEVGSGRGGGASWVARHYQPASMTGLDFSPTAIDSSKKWHAKVPNLQFIEGDAENLPFPDASFDIVINVESSHCYGDMNRFVQEVARVLRPGGQFGWVDMRSPRMMQGTQRAFDNSGLQIVEEDQLNEGVVRALNAAETRKAEIIGQAKFATAAMRQFAGAKGSALYKALGNNDVLYLLKIFRKPCHEATNNSPTIQNKI